MSSNVWFFTGAGRGLGLDIAKAALAAGHKVVATGRSTEKVAKALEESENLLVVKLDVTSAADAKAAAQATLERFGRIDVLVNNAASFYAGYFEELTPEQMDRQLATSLLGPMNVTRAFLPAMRQQRSGRILSISSTAGLMGYEFCTAYSASKFGLDGWMEALQTEVAPFGIETMIVNPGLLPHRAPHGGVHQLCGALHRGLSRAADGADRLLEVPERQAGGRPRQARARPDHAHGPGRTAATLPRRR